MKTKLVLFVLICIALGSLLGYCTVGWAADTWYKGTTVTFAWDAVTAYEDGTPVVAGETVTYKIYVKNDKTGAEILIGSATGAQTPVVVPSRGWWRFGTQATIPPDVSSISWSSSAVACLEGQTFGLRYLFPADPKNLRRVVP